jgi:hypothetical protein
MSDSAFVTAECAGITGLGQVRTLTPRKRRGAPRAGERERRNQPTVEIGPDVVSDEAVCGLLEDWLIPLIVEDLIQRRLSATARSDSPD